MKVKLGPSAYYIAGLLSKTKEENNAIGVKTGMPELEERFVEIAIKDFKIDSKKILFEKGERHVHVYFYHSQIAKQLKAVIKSSTKIFTKRDIKSASYLAGIFDAAGHVGRNEFKINGLTAADIMVLENLGVHTHGDKIVNIGSFVQLVKDRSVILKQRNL
jgi:intein/homing endonuclease